jgi:outer membrane protein assembly factor BamB
MLTAMRIRWIAIACCACSARSEPPIPPEAPSPQNAGLAAAPWPAPDHDVHHQRRTLSRGPRAEGVRWIVPLSVRGRVPSPVVAADGTIFVGGSKELLAIGPDGSVRMRRTLTAAGNEFGDPVLARDGSILVEAGGQWHRLGPGLETVQLLNVVDFAESAMIAADGSLILATHDSFVAIDRVGKQLWRFREPCLSVCGAGTVSIARDGSLRVTFSNDVIALSSDGKRLWSGPGAQPVSSARVPPAVVANDGTTFFAREPELFAFDAQGKQRFYRADAKGRRFAVASDGTLYGDFISGFAGVSPNGELRPSLEMYGAVPAIDGDGVVYAAGTGESPRFVALRPDGSELWRQNWSGQVEFGPVSLGDGVAYVVATTYAERALYAIGR